MESPLEAIDGFDVEEHPGYREMVSAAVDADRNSSSSHWELAKAIIVIGVIIYFEIAYRLLKSIGIAS